MAQDLFGAPPRARLHRLAEGLRTLHRVLIDHTKRDYERRRGPVQGPYALFALVAEDPFFAWLQPMTRAIVELEELLDRKEPPIGRDDVDQARARLERLMTTAGEPFADRYLALLQSDPDVAAEHGRFKSSFA